MRKDTFWTTIEQTIESSLSMDKNRNGLYDIVVAAYSANEALERIDAYLNDPANYTIYMDYTSCRGYVYSLNYFRDNKHTPKTDYQRIQNVMELGYALKTLEKKFETGKNPKNCRKKIKYILGMILKETEALLLEEVDRCNLKESLKGISTEYQKDYLNKILNCSHKKWDFSSFLLNKLNSTL